MGEQVEQHREVELEEGSEVLDNDVDSETAAEEEEGTGWYCNPLAYTQSQLVGVRDEVLFYVRNYKHVRYRLKEILFRDKDVASTRAVI